MNKNRFGESTMRTLLLPAAVGVLLFTSGCATSSKVQEMIDASQQDYSDTIKAHGDSINLLKQSSMKALEQNEAQADELNALQKQLEAALAQLKPMQGNAEAAKVMSAANTVKVAELGDAVQASQEAINETVEKMETIDRLFEEVMISHYRNIADSANAAIAALQADDVATTNGAPAGLAEPIEIVAPDASAPTNEAVGEPERVEEGM
jgi:ABC-type transporter Mla subunit MlaD